MKKILLTATAFAVAAVGPALWAQAQEAETAQESPQVQKQVQKRERIQAPDTAASPQQGPQAEQQQQQQQQQQWQGRGRGPGRRGMCDGTAKRLGRGGQQGPGDCCRRGNMGRGGGPRG